MQKLDIQKIKSEAQKFVSKINEKNPYYLIIGILVLVLLFDYLLIMQFQLGALRTLGPKISGIKDNFEQFDVNKGRVEKYKNDVKELDVRLIELDKRLHTTEEIPVVLEELSRIANRNKILVEQVLPETNLGDPVLKDVQGKYYLLPVVVDAKSSYHNFGRFLNELETEGPLMKIDQIMVASSKENPRQHIVKLKIQAVIFEPASGVKK